MTELEHAYENAGQIIIRSLSVDRSDEAAACLLEGLRLLHVARDAFRADITGESIGREQNGIARPKLGCEINPASPSTRPQPHV